MVGVIMNNERAGPGSLLSTSKGMVAASAGGKNQVMSEMTKPDT